MRFRLVHYVTREQNKYQAENRHEYLGDGKAIWNLWYLLHREMKYPHVEVFSLDGTKLEPESGLHAMQDYNV